MAKGSVKLGNTVKTTDIVPAQIITPQKVGRKVAGVRLMPDLLESIHRIAYWEGLTLTQIYEAALRSYVRTMEANKGKPYPPKLTPAEIAERLTE